MYWPQARENACDEVKICFSFASDWLRRWREFSRPITERSKPKPVQSRITFDAQMKIALKGPFSHAILITDQNNGPRNELTYCNNGLKM